MSVGISKEVKDSIIKEYATHEGDTGSADVQIALLTYRIKSLTKHLESNPNDNHSRRGLLQMVGERKRLQRYLENTDVIRYRALKEKLGLRK